MLIALAAGASGFLAHPPVGWWWTSFLPVPLILVAILSLGPRAATSRLPALLGLVAGLATFLPLLWWLAGSAAGPVAWLLLAAMQAAWFALFAYVVSAWIRSAWLPLVAAVAWTGMEVWRGSWPVGGFGWGELAYAHVGGSPWLAWARVVGGHGLTLITALAGASAVALVLALRAPRSQGAASAAGLGLALAVGLSVVPGPAPPPSDGSVDLLAVQGNDLPEGSRTVGEDVAIAERMLSETRQAVRAGGTPALTIWPESSIDRDPYTPGGADLAPFLDAAAELTAGNLLVGARLDGPRPQETFLNVALLVDDGGSERDRYVKRQLVPFGEYIPLGLRRVVGDLPAFRSYVARDALPGDRPGTIRTPVADVAVLICFETLFPRLAREHVVQHDAEILVAMTNDATFGFSAESDQHVDQTRLRAVETGRWAVHSALSGGSALIDAHGTVLERTGLFERATVRAEVPLAAGSTVFLRTGDLVGETSRWASLALLVAGALLRRRRTRP